MCVPKPLSQAVLTKPNADVSLFQTECTKKQLLKVESELKQPGKHVGKNHSVKQDLQTPLLCSTVLEG